MAKPKTVSNATAVTAGCDCHLDSFTMVMVDGVGQPLEAARLVNDVAGWGRAVETCRRLEVSVVGIEGASGYGRSLAQTLDRAGVGVLEVPTRLTARLRRIDGAGKTDPGDATAIARAVLSGQGSVWRDDPDLETVRVVSHRREELVRTQTQEINRLRALLAEIDPGRVQAMGRLRSLTQLQALAKVRYGGDSHRQTVAVLIRRIAADARDRLGQIRGLEKTLTLLLPPLGWTLISQTQGMGVVTAAALLAELAGTDRFATDAKMAAWAGIAPLDASSGRQHRHRLNRGGTGKPTGRSTPSLSPNSVSVAPPPATSISGQPKAKPNEKHYEPSNGTSSATSGKSSETTHPPKIDIGEPSIRWGTNKKGGVAPASPQAKAGGQTRKDECGNRRGS